MLSMKITRVPNPEWEDALYEEVFVWLPKFTKKEQDLFLKHHPIRRYKDPYGKIEVPKFLLKKSD